MSQASQPLLTLTASDLMTRNVVRLTEQMPLREAACLLFQNRVSGAPVVDKSGRCMGVLSTTDFLRVAVKSVDQLARLASGPLPITCPFQIKQTALDGKEVVVCTLPLGVCPIQVQYEDAQGSASVVCSQPHCVLADWQMVELEKFPTDPVRQFMTADPVTTTADMPIRTLARRMIDAHIHRVIVVDEKQRPIGIVTSTDLLAAIAYAENER